MEEDYGHMKIRLNALLKQKGLSKNKHHSSWYNSNRRATSPFQNSFRPCFSCEPVSPWFPGKSTNHPAPSGTQPGRQGNLMSPAGILISHSPQNNRG